MNSTRRTFVIGLSATMSVAYASPHGSSVRPVIKASHTGPLEVSEAHLSWDRERRVVELLPFQHQVVAYDLVGGRRWQLSNREQGPGVNFPWKAATHGQLIFVLFKGASNVGVINLETGRWVRTIGDQGPDRLRRPADMVVGPDGRLYVSDIASRSVKVLAADGALLGRFGDNARIAHPCGIALDPAGRLHVCDRGSRNIQVWDKDGARVRSYGVGEVSAPTSIVLAQDGTAYVADAHARAIQVFSSEGRLLDSIAVKSGDRSVSPTHLSWTPTGRLYARVYSAHHNTHKEA